MLKFQHRDGKCFSQLHCARCRLRPGSLSQHLMIVKTWLPRSMVMFSFSASLRPTSYDCHNIFEVYLMIVKTSLKPTSYCYNIFETHLIIVITYLKPTSWLLKHDCHNQWQASMEKGKANIRAAEERGEVRRGQVGDDHNECGTWWWKFLANRLFLTVASRMRLPSHPAQLIWWDPSLQYLAKYLTKYLAKYLTIYVTKYFNKYLAKYLTKNLARLSWFGEIRLFIFTIGQLWFTIATKWWNLNLQISAVCFRCWSSSPCTTWTTPARCSPPPRPSSPLVSHSEIENWNWINDNGKKVELFLFSSSPPLSRSPLWCVRPQFSHIYVSNIFLISMSQISFSHLYLKYLSHFDISNIFLISIS